MLKSYLAFVKKETLHIFRDPRTLAILFGMPIILVLIFGYTVTNEFKDASIGIIDNSKDNLSAKLVQHVTSSGHFKLIESPSNVKSLTKAFKHGRIKMGLIIPPNFEKEYLLGKPINLQIITDASEPNYAETLTNYANRMIADFQHKENQDLKVPFQLEVEIRMLYNPKLIGAYNFIPGVVALILMLICAMMTSLTIAKEKETGTMDLLLVSPLHPLVIIIGKVTPYIVLSFINSLVVFAMGFYLFDVPILGSLPLLLVLTLLYLTVALALGILISTRSSTQQVAMMSSLFILLMPTMLLSGFIFPIASMPAVLQFIAKIIPARYFIEIEKAIMLKGAGFESILNPTLILALMVALLLTVALKNFKVIYK